MSILTDLSCALRRCLIAGTSGRPQARPRRGRQFKPTAAQIDVLETRQMFAATQLGSTESQLTASNTLSNFSASAGTDRLLVVSASSTWSTDIINVTFDGQAMTQITEVGSYGFVDSIWVLPLGDSVSASNGDVTISTNYGGSNLRYISATVFGGIDQDSPTSSPYAARMTSNAEITATSSRGDLVYDFISLIASDGGSPTGTPGSGQTAIASKTGDDSPEEYLYINSTEAGAPSVLMSYTVANRDVCFYSAVNLRAVNAAPSGVALQNTTTTLPENTSTAARVKVADIAVTDDDSGDNWLTLTGTDAASFEIVSGALYLKAGTALDYETKTTYDVTVNVDDDLEGTTPDATVDFTLTISDSNDAPTAVALQNTTTTLPEDSNTASRIKMADIVVTDVDAGTNGLSLTGVDANDFEIDSGVLYLKAGTVLDFETNASFDVTVNVDDTTVGSTPDASVNFTLSLTDANDAPLIGGTAANQAVNDNSTVAPFSTLTVTDPDTQAMFARVTIVNGMNRGDFTSASAIGWTRSVNGYDVVYHRSFNTTANIGSTVQTAIRALTFQPRQNVLQAGLTERTGFTVFLNDQSATATSTGTSVITTSVNDVAEIDGAASNLAITDQQSINPFSTMTVTDPDTQAANATVTIVNGTIRGDFSSASATGWTRTVMGYDIVYTRVFSATSNIGGSIQTALQSLTFEPRQNVLMPGASEKTGFIVSVSDGFTRVTDNSTMVTTTSVNNAPTAGSLDATQSLTSNSTLAPFGTWTLSDPDYQDQFGRITIENGVNRGDFSTLSATGWTRTVNGSDIIYTRYFVRSANIGGTVQTAIQGLTFVPRAGLTQAESTRLWLYLKDGSGSTVNQQTLLTTSVV